MDSVNDATIVDDKIQRKDASETNELKDENIKIATSRYFNTVSSIDLMPIPSSSTR